ncbi:type II toxin-antitoxin system RatA family toxin [Amycolatopsis cihanbeyliensis]|uniref:Polyketide cyclase/dehydrase/lipid transport protein n=1 Tax=Amycolatopsis cihanbeyliensis TaxID=1128664 RepID=A0A542DPW1_AMYCI|nr:SRPBCC family protein [Amycolatopsis cihanbeyliensis]TQJ05139.1 polyketide cyclase/dehydrase/lipid transport protein [Amycolatopsis cihanbeyliensis]
MTTRTLKATARCSTAELFERLGDDLSFPGLATDVLSVSEGGDGLRNWVLAFRGGTAEWVQRNRVAPDRIEFEQVTGDFQTFHGSWSGTDGAGGCEVVFEVSYRTSVPHLAGAVDSAVGRVLLRGAHQILAGIAEVEVTEGRHFLRDPNKGRGPGR